MRNRIRVFVYEITGCEGCPMYSFEEGIYHRCNFYDKHFDIVGLYPKGTQRPEFCKVKKVKVVQEEKI